MNDITDKLIKLLDAYADAEKAQPMSAYMKNKFQYFGIKSPERKTLFKQWLKENPSFHKGIDLKSYQKTLDIVWELFNQPQRELSYCAVELLEKTKKEWRLEDITFFEKFIITNSWWDTVDYISTNIVGAYFIKYPDQIRPVTEGWMQSNNIWLQRVCLIFQLKYRKNTDFDLMTTYILRLKDSNEFFIQKAIGWALREYAKHDANAVKNFVEMYTLKPLSKREALKHIG